MSQSNSKLDAFELNLQQIQQTNDILHSIENKLNDVFLNQSPSYKRKLEFNQYNEGSNQKISPNSNIKLQDFPIENPSFNNDDNNKMFFNSSTTKILHPNQNKLKINRNISKQDENYDFPIEFHEFNLNDKHSRDDNGYHSSIKMVEDYSNHQRSLYSVDLKSKEELDQEMKNLQRRLYLLERENELKSEELKTSRQKIQNLENSLSCYKSQRNNYNNDYEDNPKKDYNLAKMELLEERMKDINEENKALIRERSNLLSKLYEVEQELKDKQKVLKNFEGIKQECEEKIAFINKNHLENSKRIIEEFKIEINNLNKQLNCLSKEKEDFANNQKLLEKEKNKLNSSYSNLLNIHNQMLQIDIIKNEKNLQNSFSEQNNSDSFRNSKKIIENLQSYKNEVEKLKNQSNASDNYMKELTNLKEEIEKQKKENISLMQEINNVKSDKKNDNEINKMQEYVQKLEDAYKNIENKYNEQIMINKEMKNNWKNIEAKNRDSYDKIEKIYKKFCENEIGPKITIPSSEKISEKPSEKMILHSCPLSTKNIPPPENKTYSTVTSLMKTKKIGQNTKERVNIVKPLSKKRSNSNNNLKKK